MKTRLRAIVLPLFVASMSGCGLLSDSDEKIYFNDSRQPDELEWQYLGLANELRSSKPCYLIHPKSLRKGAFNSIGNQVALIRSQCFLVAAVGSGNARVCQEVRSASTLFLSGANMNADLCRQLTSMKGGYAYDLDVAEIVSLAGYSEDEVNEYLVSEQRFSSVDRARHYRQERSSTYWGEVRRNLLHSEGFFERIEHLPSFGTAEDAAQMKKVSWDPRPQGQWVPPEQRTGSVPQVRLPAQAPD